MPSTQQRSTFGEKRARIREVLGRGIGIVYQPVADIRRGTIVGVEALARFPDRTPDVWFEEAWSVGLGLELEIEAIRRALVGAEDLPSHVYVAVNAAPETLMSNELLELLADAQPERIVVEVTEHAAVGDYAQMNLALGRLRALGVRLAIDDVGAGFSSLQHVLNLRPDKIKLDRSLTTKIDENPVLAALAAALVTFAASLGARVIAEGIETVGELVSLQKMGVAFGQGYFLARPGPLPLPKLPDGVWTTSTFGEVPMLRPSPSAAVLSPTRIEALRASRLLDSAAEESFDRLSRLATRVLGVPVALVSLVDEHRQFFKSAVGLSGPIALARETPLTHSFCQIAVTTRLPVIVDDARAHPLVRDNGAVQDLGVVAYMGIPLITTADEALGAFCAISPGPRAWSRDDLDLMNSIAVMVVEQIELRVDLARRAERDAVERKVVSEACASIFVGDVAGRIRLASDRMCALLGRAAGELRGQRVRSFVHPADLPGAIELHRRLLAGELAEVRTSLRFRRADGEWLRGTLSWKVLRDGVGRVCLTTGIIEMPSASLVPARTSRIPSALMGSTDG